MSIIKNENFIVIQGFMVNELKLKGNDLLIYAIIYGFSQTKEQYYTGSLQYLADWTNSYKGNVSVNLKRLIDKGLIVKEEVYKNGAKYCKYSTTHKRDYENHNGVVQTITGCYENHNEGDYENHNEGVMKIRTNNIDNKKELNNIEDIIDIYNTHCTNLPQVQKLTDKRKKSIKAFLKEFTIEDFKEICNKANKSSFLTGNNDKNWKADFDFLMRTDKATKILEDGYMETKKSNNIFREIGEREGIF